MNAPRHTRQVGLRFSASAAQYDRVTRVQEAVAQRVLDLIPPAEPATSILDVGCGTGRLMARLRQRWPRARLTGVDIAAGMLTEARRRFADDSMMDWILSDATEYRGGPFDLVVSGSALQWVDPLADTLAHLFDQVRPGGLLAVGLMTRGTLRELRAARAAAAGHKPAARDLPAFDRVCQAVAALPGAEPARTEEQAWTFIYPNARDLLLRLHGMGVTGGDLSRGSAALQRGELKALMAYYDRHYQAPEGGVYATFTAGYFVRRRKQSHGA